jgi:tetratricopeptide (TPR) repeat protein
VVRTYALLQGGASVGFGQRFVLLYTNAPNPYLILGRGVKRPQPKATPGRTTVVAWFAVFVVAAGVAYSSAIRAPFVFDDIPAIRQNRSIQQIAGAFDPPPNTPVSGRPIVNLTLAINHSVAGDNPDSTVGYHVVNVAIHILCGFLLFALIRRTLTHSQNAQPRAQSPEPSHLAGFTTLLWLVHPIQTEAVDYVIQRTELLVSAFYLATIFASIRAWDAASIAARRSWLALALIAAALGMASKEVMATVPFMVLLHDRAFRASSWRELLANRTRVLFYAGLLAVVVLVFLSVSLSARGSSVGFDRGVTWYQYLYTQAWAVARYLRLLVWPSGLTFDYGDRVLAGARGIPGALILSLLMVVTVWAWTRARWLWLGFLGAWFFVLIAPSSSVVPITTEIAAERRVYLASAALVLLFVLGVRWLRDRTRAIPTHERLVLGALVVIFGALTFSRGLLYAEPERLFRDNIRKTPQNPRAHVSLALTLAAEGSQRFPDAEASVRDAIALDSSSFVAWRTLGVLQLIQARWREAIPSLERALRLSPDNLDVTVGLARAHIQLGEPAAALPYVDRIGTVDLNLLWSLGALLVEEGKGAIALPYLERAADIGEPSAQALALLSLAYAQSGNADRAMLAAQVATSSAPDTAAVFVFAGRAMIAAGRLAEARAYLQHALRLDPSSTEARAALNSIDRRRRN